MIRRLIDVKLRSEERKLGGSLDYVRHILAASFGAFLKFLKVLPLSQYRRTLPPEPYFVARLVATRDEDCGTCVQIEANLARQAGVSKEIVQTVLASDPDALPEALADTYRFAEAVVGSTGQEDSLRDRMRAHYGETGLVELALAMASCRVFPITKRALGYATSCAQVEVQV